MMKLRNKKTGEIIDPKRQVMALIVVRTDDREVDGFSSIAELSKYWEDYQPAEPLIKDEKIRKAVRAWAEAIGKKDNLVLSKNMEYHDCCIYDGNLGNTALIDFGVDLDIEENDYTLSELCGEEEKCES